MQTSFADRIMQSNASRKSREAVADFVLSYREVFAELVALAFDPENKHAHKACWILEIVAQRQLAWFAPQLDFICTSLKSPDDQSAIRCVAKVCQLLAASHLSGEPDAIKLNENQLLQMTEACFDWLIGNHKVAAKAYAMRTLFLLGNQFEWIGPELQTILEKDYRDHSAAYKAAAREILKKLSRIL